MIFHIVIDPDAVWRFQPELSGSHLTGLTPHSPHLS